MNLEELRSALASDATEKAKAQEKLIKSLKRQLKEKNDTLAARDDVLRTMFNRCLAQTGGAICLFCSHEGLCYELRSVGKRRINYETTDPQI